MRDISPTPASLTARDPQGTLHGFDADACCSLRKVEPLERALRPFAAWVTTTWRPGAGTPEAQEIAAQNFYRPLDPAILARHADVFPKVATFTIADTFGTWPDVQRTHFGDGGIFDQIYKPGN